MALQGSVNSEKIWNYFAACGMSRCGIAGLIGNLDCESGLNPRNMEDQYERKLGYSDDTYTEAVDKGRYQNFVSDGVGFGIAQWTWHTRKQDLLNYARSTNRSVGDLETQLDFLKKELTEKFLSVWKVLMNATSVTDASNTVLLRFECPLDQSPAVQSYRASVCQNYYNKYGGASSVSQSITIDVPLVNGYYVFTKGTRKKLSQNFATNEFDCHGSGCCTQTRVNKQLVEYLQKIRDHFNAAITISSAFRCVTHNSSDKVKGATGSRHTLGDAADIVVAGHAPREVAAYCESIGILGIGLYETASDSFFVHIDTRTYKSFWYGQAQSPRTTFISGNSASSSENKQNSGNSKLLTLGSSGSEVKDLQNKLIKLGFNCGVFGADGQFGNGTFVAVKEFQKSVGMTGRDVDGIVGKTTASLIQDAVEKLESKNKYIVTASALNVRDGAGMECKVIRVIKKDTELTISEIKNGWGNTVDGWVSMEYVRQKG